MSSNGRKTTTYLHIQTNLALCVVVSVACFTSLTKLRQEAFSNCWNYTSAFEVSNNVCPRFTVDQKQWSNVDSLVGTNEISYLWILVSLVLGVCAHKLDMKIHIKMGAIKIKLLLVTFIVILFLLIVDQMQFATSYFNDRFRSLLPDYLDLNTTTGRWFIYGVCIGFAISASPLETSITLKIKQRPSQSADTQDSQEVGTNAHQPQRLESNTAQDHDSGADLAFLYPPPPSDYFEDVAMAANRTNERVLDVIHESSEETTL